MHISWELHENGSFDIYADSIQLINCYPAFDEVSIHPRSITVERQENEITYHLMDGRLILKLGEVNGVFAIQTVLEGMSKAPHWVYPVAGAEVLGADRFYKQGLGFAGPSGIREVGAQSGMWLIDSHMVSGFIAPDETALAIGAYEHRDFLQRSALYNHGHKWGLTDRRPHFEKIFYEAGFGTENLAIPEEGLRLPALYFHTGAQPYDTFRRLAQSMAETGQARTHMKPSYHWCSWYHRTCHFNMKDLNALLAGLKTIKPVIPIQTIQLDDGYCASPGDWLEPNANYPGGLPAAASLITGHGYRAGIWIAPFMVGCRSRLYREHPDWVLRGKDGKPVVEWTNYDGGAIAAHNDEETYCMDTSHPDALAYIRGVFKALRGMGFTFYKTDFLDWGLKDSLEVLRHTPGKTSVQYFVDVMKMIREEIGAESYWLGCISPFAPQVGFVDGMRLSNDVGSRWHHSSAGNMLEEVFAGQFFNNVFWQNDPDVLYLRERFIHLSHEEILSIALWNGITGGAVYTSDAFHELPAERLKLWRFLQPTSDKTIAVLPFWSRPGKVFTAVRYYHEGNACGILMINASDEQLTAKFDLKDLTGKDHAFCYEWGPGWSQSIGNCTMLAPQLKPHACILYYANFENDRAPAENMGLSGITVEGL